jgi:DNA-binding MarR family transcriptional regulator
MNRVLDSLRTFQLAQAAAMRRAADALDVSDTALNTLNTLIHANAESGLPMKELAREVGVSRAVLTGLVDRLEERGWVERRLSPTDRRSTVVVPTIVDESPVARILRALDEPMRKVANSIGDDVAAVVRRMAAGMEAELRNFDPGAAMQGSAAGASGAGASGGG